MIISLNSCNLPAGDQFQQYSRQCWIFGRIGDQWVAISSPGPEKEDSISEWENSDSELSDQDDLN